MKILWLDINSSYSHSSVALPAIHAQTGDKCQWEWCVVRGTINNNPGTIASAVARQRPDIIAATFWLFTHRMQIEVLSRVATLLEGVKIICGGPEFLGDNENFLRTNKFVTAIIRGEGERALPRWLETIEKEEDWSEIEGLCWLNEETGQYRDNGIARVADFSALKYPEESSFFNWDKPFVQLETTRGCFNTCAFCVSGGEKPVRYQSIEQVKERLENICAHGIKDIRVLDRTFNYDTQRACEMLDIFTGYADRMRFHLEIHPALLSETLKQKMETLPKGLLHLEAGIQSLDSKVLSESGRKGSLEASLKGLEYLCSLDNIETHADLIAGLPEYSLEMLCGDIARLIEMGVDELQIESLKVLPGTKMRTESRERYLRYSPMPPYEILQTPSMSGEELLNAMQVSRTVDLYYNCPTWQKVIRSMISVEFIKDFTAYLKTRMILDSPVSVERRGVILYEYCKDQYPEKLTEVSVAWIEAGLSLKKEHAGEIIRIKHLEAFLESEGLQLSTGYGQMDPSHRYFMLKSGDRRILFGFDSQNHQPSPVYKGEVTQRHN
jgi:radical SAM superfamily enzyme YgiQ (UPF0313 family)